VSEKQQRPKSGARRIQREAAWPSPSHSSVCANRRAATTDGAKLARAA
jgi:hypothetical protein